MNYEVQQALGRKVDEWQYRALEQTVDQQKYTIRQLEDRIGRLESTSSTNYYIIESLLNLLIEQIPDKEYELIDIKRNL